MPPLAVGQRRLLPLIVEAQSDVHPCPMAWVSKKVLPSTNPAHKKLCHRENSALAEGDVYRKRMCYWNCPRPCSETIHGNKHHSHPVAQIPR